MRVVATLHLERKLLSLQKIPLKIHDETSNNEKLQFKREVGSQEN